MGIGQRIKSKRIELKMSQQELATKMGYSSRSSICDVEKGHELNLTTDRISAFAKALGVPTSYLMGWTDENSVALPESPQANAIYDAELLSIIKDATVEQKDMIINYARYVMSQGEINKRKNKKNDNR